MLNGRSGIHQTLPAFHFLELGRRSSRVAGLSLTDTIVHGIDHPDELLFVL